MIRIDEGVLIVGMDRFNAGNYLEHPPIIIIKFVHLLSLEKLFNKRRFNSGFPHA